MSGLVVHALNLNAGEGETGRPWALWPASLAYLVSSRPMKDLSQKKKKKQGGWHMRNDT